MDKLSLSHTFDSPAIATRCARRFALAIVACAGLLAGLQASVAQSPAPDPAVARVGETDIHESDLRLAEEEIGQSIPEQEAPARREVLLTYLSDMIILSKLAVKQNVVDEADLKRRLDFARSRVLMQQMLQATAQKAVNSDAARQAYDAAVEKTPTEPELHIRSILFKFSSPSDTGAVEAAEERAKAAATRIAGGEDFAAVAREVTDNESNKNNGGDLGYLTRFEMGKEYADVAFTLEKGVVSDPIKTQFGWHLIKVEDQRMRKPADFETVRSRFEAMVARKAQYDLVAKLRSAMKVERFDTPKPADKPDHAGDTQ